MMVMVLSPAVTSAAVTLSVSFMMMTAVMSLSVSMIPSVPVMKQLFQQSRQCFLFFFRQGSKQLLGCLFFVLGMFFSHRRSQIGNLHIHISLGMVGLRTGNQPLLLQLAQKFTE